MEALHILLCANINYEIFIKLLKYQRSMSH